MTDQMPAGFYPDMTDAEYFGLPGLHQSSAKYLIPPSTPAHFWAMINSPRKPSTAFDFGHAAHLKATGRGPEIVLVPFDDYRTKAAQQARDFARAEGRIPLRAADLQIVEDMAGALLAHPAVAEVLTDPSFLAEVSMLCTHPTGPVICGKADLISSDLIVDYKTTVTAATADQFARTVLKYHYDMQAAWYLTITDILGKPRQGFWFIVQEKNPPYLPALLRLDDEFLEHGYQKMTDALALYSECSDTHTWPGYPADLQPVHLPAWARTWNPDMTLYTDLENLLGDLQ